MKTKTKILLSFFTLILLILSTVSGTVLYFYSHPAVVKTFLEKYLPMSMNASLTISELSYSIKPLNIHAKGISLRPRDNSRNYFLNINDLSTDLSLEGRFGHKSLIIKSLKANGLSSQIADGAELGSVKYRSKDTSYLSKVTKRLFYLLFFRDVEIRRIEIKDGAITAKSGNGLAELTKINAYMNDDRQIEISCGISVDLPSEKTSFNANKISITTDRAITFIDPEIRCKMKVQKATLRSPDADVKDLDLYSEVIYSHKHRNLAFESVDLNLGGTTLRLNQEKSSPLDIDITAGIIFDLIKKEANIQPVNIELTDRLLLKAVGKGTFGPEPSIEIDLSECTVIPQHLRHLLPFPNKEIIDPFSLSGEITFNGAVQGNKAGEKWGWNVNLSAKLNDNSFSYTKEGLRLDSLISASVKAEGQLPNLKISASIKGDDTTLSAEGIELKPFKTSLTLYGKVPEFAVEDFTAHIPESYITIGNKWHPINDIQFYFKKGSFNWKNRSFLIPGIEIDSSLLKNLKISLESDGKNTDFHLQGKDINLTQSALALEFLPPGWDFKGTDCIQIDAFLKQNGRLNFLSDLEFKKYGLQNQDSSCLGENLSATIKANGEMDLQKLHLTGNAIMDIREGEILYDVFYLDLKKSAFFSSCSADYDIPGKCFSFSRVGLGLKGILNSEAHGKILKRPEGQHISLSISVPETNLKPAFKAFVLEPFKSEKPFLNDLNIDGQFSADLNLNKTESKLELLGHFLLHDAGFSLHSDGFSLDAVDLDLPMHYQSGQTVLGEIPGKGKLKVEKMKIPWLPEQSLSLTLEANPNLLKIPHHTTIKIPGGEVQIGPVTCRDIFGPQISILTDVDMTSVDIKPVLSRFWPRPVGGKISGKLDTIHFQRNKITSNGSIIAKIFGGEIVFSDIGASGLFSYAPVFKLDSHWNDLSLSELTSDTSFGKIEGVLKGHVKDLQIAYGQPQKFDLLLETEKKKGVPQKISITAIDNIAGIGGGQSPFVGAAGLFTYFFQKFPYNKIGIHASLENDVFRINGTITEGGIEYLMKRGSLSGVNIVNQNPDNRISLKDMIKRIKRVGGRHGEAVVK